jgi:hypothetical protein
MTAGMIGQWQSLPFPVRLAGIFLAGMAMIWLARWLGGVSLLVALLLWSAVGIGLLYASGRLAGLDRYPFVARLLDRFAPRLAMRAPPVAATSPWPDEIRVAPAAPVPAVDLADFVGLDDVFAEIENLVATLGDRIRPVAPATMILLVGPRGTGKSSVAQALADRLYRAGARPSDRIVVLGPAELSGLGPSKDPMKVIGERIQGALDGTLLIDDLDWVAGGGVAGDIGHHLLTTARRYPGRLFIIGTGSAAAVGRLDPANRWLGQLNVRRIDFPSLENAALLGIFGRLLEEKGLALADGADRAVKIQIEERRAEGDGEFDNAHAIRRLVDDVLHSRSLRLRGSPPEQTAPLVTAEDVRNARPSL